MIVFSYLGAPSNWGLDQRLYGLSGVRNVPGGGGGGGGGEGGGVFGWF